MANFFQRLMSKNTVPTDEELEMLVYGKQPKVDTTSQEYLENMGSNTPKQSIGNKLGEYLLGKQMPTTDNIGTTTDENGNIIQSVNISNPSRQGGLFRDIADGYNENRNQGFSLNNWGQGSKNIGTRIGEGLGSLVKFAESPAGRALLTGAAVSALGGNPLQSVAYGATAGLGNQQNRLADQLYRDDLTNQGIDTSNVKGYMNDRAYQNMLRSKQLQDNAAYRQMYYDTMLQNHADDLEFKKMQAEAQRQEKAAERANQNYWKGQELGLGYAKLNADKQDKMYKEYEKQLEKQNEYNDVENQLKAFENTFKSANNPLRYRAFGGVSNALNTLSPQEANFNAQRTLLFNQIARKLGGEKGVLSDADIKRVEAALPSLSDTYEQKQAKMKSIYSLLDIKKGGSGSFQGKSDPLGIR